MSPTHCRPAAHSPGQIEGETTVIGLLRIGEPKGGFLRANDSANDCWYSRDGAPMGGLTVIASANWGDRTTRCPVR